MTQTTGAFPPLTPFKVINDSIYGLAYGTGNATSVYVGSTVGLAASTANSPAATTVGTTSSQLLALNAVRRKMYVQNTGITTIYLGLNQTPTITAYHIALAPCGSSNDGTGGILMEDAWSGIVNAISSSAGGTVTVTEY